VRDLSDLNSVKPPKPPTDPDLAAPCDPVGSPPLRGGVATSEAPIGPVVSDAATSATLPPEPSPGVDEIIAILARGVQRALEANAASVAPGEREAFVIESPCRA
jgi:hypothetical protein